MWFLFALIGAVLATMFSHEQWLTGAAIGAFFGWWLESRKKLERQFASLSTEQTLLATRLAALEAKAVAPLAEEARDSAPAKEGIDTEAAAQASAVSGNSTAESPSIADSGMICDPASARESQPYISDSPVGETSSSGLRHGRPLAETPEVPSEPNAIARWFSSGNAVVRAGAVILFFGVAFLLKYAYERSHVPIEWRLAGVSLGSLVMLVMGWRLRLLRPGYALTLQGGGVGLLYLTIFAAFRLYQVLPPLAAIVLLFAVAIFSALLAVWQDSRALAVIGVTGGFLAPILASTGHGSHVMLFSYYLVLNGGIFAIAWYKSWRSLNLIGFVFTFVIGTLWGSRAYQPELFASTEFFLAAFFLLYVAIPILFARREAIALRHYVDGSLVFGVPLVAFAIQVGVVRSFEFGSAFSAIGLAAFYLLLAFAAWRRHGRPLRLLAESYLALGVMFATIAIPLFFDGRTTSAIWALEGAAVVWVSVRQQRVLARAFGLALQLVAGVAFLGEIDHGPGPTPLLNSFYLSCVFIAAGGLFCSAYLDRQHERSSWESLASTALLAWGAGWWALGGLYEIDRHLDTVLHINAALMFLVTTAAVFGVLSLALRWGMARWLSYLIVPLALAALAGDALHDQHPFAHLGWLAWSLVAVAHFAVLKRQEPLDRALHQRLHSAGVYLLTFVVSWELSWQMAQIEGAAPIWSLIAWACVPAFSVALLCSRQLSGRWPLATFAESYLLHGGAPLIGMLGMWTLYANAGSNGDPAPLSYFPLMNPLDIAQALSFLLAVNWWMTVVRRGLVVEQTPIGRRVYGSLGAMLFLWANGVLLRTLHHWADIPFQWSALVHSMRVQSALSIFWSLLALAAMVCASRRAWRDLWIVGAVLMGVVVVKLFLVDLSSNGSVERIVSFLGVGLLMLVIGYFSPAPPKRVIEKP